MRVLVACEFSGIVRDAFKAKGHDAWSCDIIPTETPGQHIINDVRNVLDWDWDLMIAHPPCTYLSYVGARWFKQPGRMDKAREAYKFVQTLYEAPIPRIAIENPHGLLSKWWRKPDDIIQPWQFGETVTKKTCLWLKSLPPLMYTVIVGNPFINWVEVQAPKSGHERSRFWPGIAKAMANQWSNL